MMSDQSANASTRAVNAPLVVILSVAAFIAVHVWRGSITEDEELLLLLTYAFIPARYLTGAEALYVKFPGGTAANVWTFATYSMLHADWLHLAVNSFWMLAFGSVVARRFGAIRFIVFSLVCAVAGAALHLGVYWGEMVPVIGASAAISGQMAGAVRFIFSRPSNLFQASRMHPHHMRAESLSQVFSNPRALAFLGVWIGINLLFGVSNSFIPGVEGQVAWEAHLGGFLAGLLLFGLFDRTVRT